MIRQARIAVFFVKQFAAVPYFFQIMLITTISTTLVQYFAATAFDAITPTQGWVRGGIIGMWGLSTTAAGIIGFERYKGTLVYLVRSPIGPMRVLTSLVGSAATFGLMAFPVSWLTWAIASRSLTFTPFEAGNWLRIIMGIVLLFCGCVTLSFSIAALFVLTPHAIAYEELLLVPVFVASGILFTSTTPGWVSIVSHALHLRLPFDLLCLGDVPTSSLIAWPISMIAWLLVAYAAGTRALTLATRAGTIEVI